MTNQVNLDKQQKDGGWAWYLPAISSFYADQLAKLDRDPNHAGRDLPKGFENKHKGMNFLDKEQSYYYYSHGLYSAGHAKLDIPKSIFREPMIQERDRKNTVIIGDSGGFQIAKGVIQLDWASVKGPAGDALRSEILRWLEYTSDWSMTLDVPPSAAARYSARTGLTNFGDTLDVTEYNLKYFIKHRTPGLTKFLNVLSGDTAENSKLWFDTVIPYSIPACVEAMGYSVDRTFEGYAFAGCNAYHMPTTLNRLLDLREIDGLKGKNWIHFLGVGRLDWACYLTAIMRQLRKHDNKDITISFDAASPFVATAKGLVYTYNTFESKRLTYSMAKGIDNKSLKNSQLQMPWGGPIMNRMIVGDVCAYGHGDKNKINKEGKTSWDTLTYLLYMSHNVYNHISAVQEINKQADIGYVTCLKKQSKIAKASSTMGSLFEEDIQDTTDDHTSNVSYKNWRKNAVITKATELNRHVPNNILYFNDFVEKLFDPNTKDPRKMILDNAEFLESISFGKTSKTAEVFNSIFETDPTACDVDQDRIADSQDDDTDAELSKLEKLDE